MAEDRPRVVLDTNVLLVSVSSRSKYHWIVQTLLAEEYDLVLSNEILAEYEEILGEKFDVGTAGHVVRTLLLLPNVWLVTPYFHWNLIPADPDDNKFVDCAVTANARLLVTHDRHYDVLREVEFPRVRLGTAADLRELLDRRRRPAGNRIP